MADHDLYATLPGTGHPGDVPHNWTDQKAKIHNLGWGGCNPSRWIYELLNNNFTTCDLFTRAQQASLDVPYPWQDHTHRLILNGNQSFVSLGARMLSSVCIDCHFHFVFNLLWDEEHASGLCNSNQKQWPPRDGRFPWHHLAWVGSDSEEIITKRRSKYYPLVTRETFVCSAGPCTFSINLEISMPRMPLWWINLLLDSDAIREELRIAKENDPERYATATDDWAMQAPINLNTYLKNLIEATSQEGARSISKRNKRFAVLFGPRCFSIFRELEFDETVDIREDDGVDEGAFTPKVPYPPDAPNGATKIGTYRGYIEDVRAEVQCLIHKRGEAAELCTPSLHAYLGCSEVPNVSSNVFVNLDRYKLMGVLPNQDKGIVDNAYRRQWDLLPKKRRELIEALGQIANDLNDQDFSYYAMAQQSVFDSQVPTQTDNGDAELINQALLFFGLQPPNNYNPDSIVLAYRRKVVDDPSDAATARSMLMLISNATSDEAYRRALEKEYEEGFSLTTAKEILGISDASFDSDTLDKVKQKILNAKHKEIKTTYLDAMYKIAVCTNSADLKGEVTQLRQQNDIIGSDLINTSSSDQPADYDLPVGLENIGNTCYLNSLLQYLFTVKPVRDIAVRYDDFKLDLTDETIEHRRIGGNKMRMKREEAVVAQAFAKELSELFTKLENSDMRATRPSQRLANAVLLDTDTLVKSANTSADSATGNQPPPLPTRPPPGPPDNDSDDVEMATTNVKDDRDPIDTASTVSSQTLIGDDSDRSYDKVETSSATNDGQIIDTVMEVEQDDDVVEISRPSHQVDEDVGTPEKRNVDDSKKDQSTDTEMIDAKESSTIDQKVLTALEHQDRSSGTDQQDVEEVMGNIISRLQAAIQPSYVNDVTGIQMESIMETFFVTTINYTKKADEATYQKEISFDRFITAFPSPQGGTCSLYDALGRNFDRQAIEGSEQSRYTAIETLPPVLHVLIQRSQSVNGKNDNPVEIPETLYLDRFMDTPHDSMTFKDREKSWAAADRISEINASIAAAESTGPTGPFLESLSHKEKADGSNAPTTEDIAMVDGGEDAEEIWEFDGPVDDDFLVVNRPSKRAVSATELSDMPQNINEIESAVREQMKTELKETTDHLETYYAQLKSNPYRLHAVICHRGSLRSGHYWVWIYDFEQNVWRKYNDSNVEVKHSTDEVLKTLSSSGEPYFLCYVRDEDKEEYVDVPRRRRPVGSGADQELPPPYSEQGNN